MKEVMPKMGVKTNYFGLRMPLRFFLSLQLQRFWKRSTHTMKTQALAILIILGAIAFYLVPMWSKKQTRLSLPNLESLLVNQLRKQDYITAYPFIQEVNRIEKRFLPWDGPANEMSTKDKTYLIIDTYARWRISDPMQYFLRLRDERSALSRLDDILGSETRNAVAKHELIEIVRTSKDRVAETDKLLTEGIGKVGLLYSIKVGREKVEEEIFKKAAAQIDWLWN